MNAGKSELMKTLSIGDSVWSKGDTVINEEIQSALEVIRK